MTVEQILQCLRVGRERVSRGWTQDAPARTADRHAVDPSDPGATCWCVWGAIQYSHESASVLLRTINARLDSNCSPVVSLMSWNDHPERTQLDVVVLFDEAIARLVFDEACARLERSENGGTP